MHYLFSYGTLQLESVQLEIFGVKLAGEKDTLCAYIVEDMRILDAKVIAASGEDIHPILKYTGQEQDRVSGMVLEINDKGILQKKDFQNG